MSQHRACSGGRGLVVAVRLAVILVSLACLEAPASSAVVAGTIEARDARIVEVTVYRDRAEIVKQAAVDVPAGPSSIEFAGLPFRVEPDTLRVSAEGVPATLGAIEIRDHVEEAVETPEWIAARDEVRRIEREVAGLDSEQVVASHLERYLNAVSNVTAADQARELGEGRADPNVIGTVYTLLETKMRELGEGRLDRDEHRRRLKEGLDVARARLATLRASSGIRSRVAVAEIDAARAGRLTLRLAYLAPGASWRPTYRATLDAGTGDVSLVAEGVVRQSTGEDWSNVDLRLSSAAPARGVQPPMLTPWFLRPLSVAQQRGPVVSKANEAGTERFYQEEAEAAMPAEAQVVRSAYNVAFKVPGGSDVPADGSAHRVVLRQETLKSNVVHRTVPEIDDRAFLTAVTTSPGDYPLLAGPVRVFAGGAYLGQFPLAETGPGIELTLPFGVDNRIEIVRVAMPRLETREGITGKYRQVARTHRTLIHNLLDRKVTLVLEDRLPVSENEQITVAIGKETTPGYKDSKRRSGVKLWTLELGPGEQREIVLDYTVKHPKELTLPKL